ncbi:MAG TPA: HipA domain-containing protein, partial [Acidimicrobiales bacterium]|nr:HipA domain-containing protein [Acidimicrobiales bacterium]
MSTVAEVRLWGRMIGAVSLGDGADTAVFQYASDFAGSGIEVAPVVMPLRAEPYTFPALGHDAFRGLPGMLADSLPDRFGNALVDTWLASEGRSPGSFDAVERLCYVGTRGMGALEFVPAIGPRPAAGDRQDIEVGRLVALASEILTERTELLASLDAGGRSGGGDAAALRDILRVGTSAGGARAKAVIAWNPRTHVVRSGQVEAGDGFEHWLLKFDGVRGNRDKELVDPQGYGAIEYAYAGMAGAAGVTMTECRLLEEGGRRHFMTRRFDRPDGGGKLHMQSLAGLAHYDFNQAGAYSYEQALGIVRQLGLSMDTVEQQFRRAAFNVVARNQDDHVKNIAFLMDRTGRWSLSPAFDVTYAYSPDGRWTSRHQMTLDGRRDDFTVANFRHLAQTASMRRGRAEEI